MKKFVNGDKTPEKYVISSKLCFKCVLNFWNKAQVTVTANMQTPHINYMKVIIGSDAVPDSTLPACVQPTKTGIDEEADGEL